MKDAILYLGAAVAAWLVWEKLRAPTSYPATGTLAGKALDAAAGPPTPAPGPASGGIWGAGNGPLRVDLAPVQKAADAALLRDIATRQPTATGAMAATPAVTSIVRPLLAAYLEPSTARAPTPDPERIVIGKPY